MKRILYRFLLITWVFSLYYVPSAFSDSNANVLLERAISNCDIEEIKIALNQGADPQAHYNNNPSALRYYEMVGLHCIYRIIGKRNKAESDILDIYKLLISCP